MSRFLRRTAAVVLSAAGVLIAALVLYLAFGDLSRHKGRIESLVTELLGRTFAIDGALELQVLPSIAVAAERLRLANADGGATADGRDRPRGARIGLWSLLRDRRCPLVPNCATFPSFSRRTPTARVGVQRDRRACTAAAPACPEARARPGHPQR
jgi:hypothetical protein